MGPGFSAVKTGHILLYKLFPNLLTCGEHAVWPSVEHWSNTENLGSYPRTEITKLLVGYSFRKVKVCHTTLKCYSECKTSLKTKEKGMGNGCDQNVLHTFFFFKD